MTVRGFIVLVAAGVLGLVASCSPADESAGWDPSVAVEVLNEIGDPEGEGLVFGLISDVEVLPDGSLLVVDRHRVEVLHVSEDGDLIEVFGGRGEGPGELVTPLEVKPLGASEYVVLDGDRMHLTRVEMVAGSHRYSGDIPIPFPSLHFCAQRGQFILDPVLHSHAVARMAADGSTIQDYHPIPQVLDESFASDAQSLLRMWEGMAIPECSPEGGVTLLYEWNPRVERFAPDGGLEWGIELAEYQALQWETGPSGNPSPSVPDGGWAHRGVTLISLEKDLILLQLARLSDDPLAANDDPSELRLLRPSDGSQVRVVRSLPRLAHVEAGRAWGWSNVPFPRLVEMSFAVRFD